ncbi:16S rRNA G966 N2-methylase RsmD [Bacillus mesophilus]|uniref:Class I SAM-dependent methyltransferase n=1 Tax=Bacillus mesophilus TaxID=1808955 RepID=A0A6M0QC33_9BACI|nr:class I SAM-dependent methyltransferase [Bacillus mesophilus]MBM7663220.1 16S rRNA G966 N2-methylase RsmD [Bacillus mesophilus]NEY73941.1 class I SAM-dependent methyltransferase [Bacillus mesophilus]
MIITTSSRANRSLVEHAHQLAKEWNESFQSRGRDSIQDIQEKFSEEVLVVGKNRIELFIPGEDQPIFFHPNSAMFRIKRLISGGHDPFVEACQLSKGMSLLDCTLGLGSDSIVASYAVGKSGQVTSIEGNKTLANLVKTGLKTWESQIPEMDDAMRAIQIQHTPYQKFLTKSDDKSFDIIYFDPMFEESIEQSVGLLGVKKLALYDDLSEQTIIEAKRVARKRIVLKDHWKSIRFEKHGFTPIRRKSANFHYGVIELE